jgi:transaldolase
VPGSDYIYPLGELKPISYQELDLNKDWQEFDITHELTDKGLQKFADDWNQLISIR